MSESSLPGWDLLRHGGLLLDPQRLQVAAQWQQPDIALYLKSKLRRESVALLASKDSPSAFVKFVLESICGFGSANGSWLRGSDIPKDWNRRTPTGESITPNHLWSGANGARLPVFIEKEKHLGFGRGRRMASLVVQWLRAGNERVAVLTNGRQWRLIFAGLDFDAWCEWDTDLWFEEGEPSQQVTALRTLISPQAWTPITPGEASPLLMAILDSRKGQAELSAILGERVREAVELLVQAHGEALDRSCSDVDNADIYRAAVRVVMRMVVILFAEARDLLPRNISLYYDSYGISGLLDQLGKSEALGGKRLARSFSAWPRILALFQLVYKGSSHEALPIRAYGGELFEPANGEGGLSRALHVFETAAFDADRPVFSDRDVHTVLKKISRTSVRLRQGRTTTLVTVPVDFSDLSSEYIGILYEGLLDFELKTVPSEDPVIFLAVGKQPALPLSRLEAMNDKALADLLEKMKDTSSGDDEKPDEANVDENAEDVASETEGDDDDVDDEDTGDHATHNQPLAEDHGDQRLVTRTRAEEWARRAVVLGKLVKKPGAKASPQQISAHEAAVAQKAKRLVARVVLPGEWYLVRWGGTRKGSGTFYTRPGLAVPTVQRTLRPLAYAPPVGPDGTPDRDASAQLWTPRLPEEILALKTCDPACGSGTFPVATLRFLTEALFASVHHHGRLGDHENLTMDSVLGTRTHSDDASESLAKEVLPCRIDDPYFEPRFKAVLKRHVVERCIYGVDLDPLAVELCRLSLWIETMDSSLPFSFLDHKIKCGNGLVGAWFDQFLHYPVMAWKNREGGDRWHSNGVHFEKARRSDTLKEFVNGRLKDDLNHFLSEPSLFDPDARATDAGQAHSEAIALLTRLHDMPVYDAAERARIYREELLKSSAYGQLKAAMDLWCACWFWPADSIHHAPLPRTLYAPSEETAEIAARIAARQRFFHWELEFPDVFSSLGSGFSAVLGNPPWDISKPNSKEFFSNIDPLYRTYGKQDALDKQNEYFADKDIERAWLDYHAGFRALSNFIEYASTPFGDPARASKSTSKFLITRGNRNSDLHRSWRDIRARTGGFADPEHPFRHQGTADINLYKTFLEQAHALLREGGRMGFIIPSGLYSDHGTGALRRLFLNSCQWEWLFGFENRDKVFDIDSRFKFNPVIIQKGGSTAAINTAFMRRKLEDWERAEDHATPYARAQVDQFSPKSQAILEIQSKRDLEILEKIYANSVLLGDDGPDGWGVKYATEFHMTNDSHLFPPRTKWEERGYRPDEYNRWLKGDWRPITELWSELGIDPNKVVPTDVELEEWLFDTSADPERRTAEARFVHGHLLKPGDVARRNWKLRCAQPPYDTIPIPRADIPAGIILSRNADAYIREDKVEDVALPLYEGKDIWIHDWAYVTDEGSSSTVRRHLPQYLMRSSDWPDSNDYSARLVFRDISNATNARSFVSSIVPHRPCGNGVPLLKLTRAPRSAQPLLCAWLGSLVFDWSVRQRMSGTHLNWHIAESLGVPRPDTISVLLPFCQRIDYCGLVFSPEWLGVEHTALPVFELTLSERLRHLVTIDSYINAWLELGLSNLEYLLSESDNPRPIRSGSSKGFWRVDKDKDPELRHTVLTLIAFHDLEQKIHEHGGDRDKGIEAFLNQNDGEGWLIPETIRLADYGLGHDERAQHHQPVASRLGPRFYDWQLMQTVEESWRECHLHARNMLGEEGYKQLLARIEAERTGMKFENASKTVSPAKSPDAQQIMSFE